MIELPDLNKQSRAEDIFGNIETVTSIPTITPVGLVNQFKLYKNGSNYTLYVFDTANNSWAAMGVNSPAYQFVSYNTASDDEIVVSGLDLTTDKSYRIIVHSRHATTGSFVECQLNSDATSGNYLWVINDTYDLAGTPTSAPDSGISTQTFWKLGQGLAGQTCVMNLHYNYGSVLADWKHSGIDIAGNDISSTTGTGYWNSNNNVTSIRFFRSGAETVSWAVWIFKTSQS